MNESLEKIDSKNITRKLLIRIFTQYNNDLNEMGRQTREPLRIKEIQEGMQICRGHIHYLLQMKEEPDIQLLLAMSNYIQEYILSLQLNPARTPHGKRMDNN